MLLLLLLLHSQARHGGRRLRCSHAGWLQRRHASSACGDGLRVAACDSGRAGGQRRVRIRRQLLRSQAEVALRAGRRGRRLLPLLLLLLLRGCMLRGGRPCLLLQLLLDQGEHARQLLRLRPAAGPAPAASQ